MNGSDAPEEAGDLAFRTRPTPGGTRLETAKAPDEPERAPDATGVARRPSASGSAGVPASATTEPTAASPQRLRGLLEPYDLMTPVPQPGHRPPNGTARGDADPSTPGTAPSAGSKTTATTSVRPVRDVAPAKTWVAKTPPATTRPVKTPPPISEPVTTAPKTSGPARPSPTSRPETGPSGRAWVAKPPVTAPVGAAVAAPPIVPWFAPNAPVQLAEPPTVINPWQPPVEEEPRRQRGPVLALAGVALAVVAGLIALAVTVFGDDGSPSDEPLAASSPPVLVTQPNPTEPSGEPGSITPGQAPVDGLSLAAAVISPTTIEVVETVHWPEGGPATIELTLSEDVAAAGGLAIAPEFSVGSLQVSVDGSPVIPSPRAGVENAWVITPASGAAPRSMEVRYLLEGAIVRSVPSSPGRALAVLTPMSAGAVGDLPIAIAISTSDVLNVYCPGGANQQAIMCGRVQGGLWTTNLPPGLPLVVAQVDLPALI